MGAMEHETGLGAKKSFVKRSSRKDDVENGCKSPPLILKLNFTKRIFNKITIDTGPYHSEIDMLCRFKSGQLHFAY